MTQSTLAHLSDQEILRTRIKDLPLKEDSLPFPHLVKRLGLELKCRGIQWTPSIWASEEWFSPDGVPGFAIPFTLLDPRLARLEKKHVGFCEGANEAEFMKLIRHECAHALDNAYHLRRNKQRQKVFGKSSLPYPSYYIPKPHSKNFVRHLPGAYAQAHPEEDWAETFAVWLTPKNKWRAKYAGWKALYKLEVMDSIMERLKAMPPKSNKSATPLHFKNDERTVAEYFAWRRTSLGLRRKNFYANKLTDIFEQEGKGAALGDLLNSHQKEIRRSVATKSRIRSYIVDNMIRELKLECKLKKYRLKKSPGKSRVELERFLLLHSNEFVKQKRHRIFM